MHHICFNRQKELWLRRKRKKKGMMNVDEMLRWNSFAELTFKSMILFSTTLSSAAIYCQH